MNSDTDPINLPRVLFVGRTTLDLIYSLDRFPAEDTKAFARAMHVAPGGPAANAAITHALLGGRAKLLTAIGRGSWASPVRDELQRLGIDLIDLAAEVGVAFFGRGAGLHIGFLDLPLDVGGAPGGFRSEG